MHGSAQGGDDILNAGAPAYHLDILYGDAYAMSESTRGGNDTLNGSDGNNALYGDAYEMHGNAQGGDDALSGGNGPDALYGDVTFLYDATRGGADTLSGSAGDDVLLGDADQMHNTAQGGNDTLNGGDGNDTRYADAFDMRDSARGGSDVLNGGAGNDVLYGDGLRYFDPNVSEASPASPFQGAGGDDTLNGGPGDDQLYGGPANDTFVFNAGSGSDMIHDFDQGNSKIGITAAEQDVIDLSDYGITDFDAWAANHITDSQNGAIITLSASDSITVFK